MVPGTYSATLATDSEASPASAMKPGSSTPPAASMIGMFRRRTAASWAIRAASARNVAVNKACAPDCLTARISLWMSACLRRVFDVGHDFDAGRLQVGPLALSGLLAVFPILVQQSDLCHSRRQSCNALTKAT